MSGFKIGQIRAQLVCSAGIPALRESAALAQSASFSLPAEPLSEFLRAVARQAGSFAKTFMTRSAGNIASVSASISELP